MFVFLLLPVLVSGFVFCNRNHKTFFKLHRFDGQHLYLKSAHFGLFHLFGAFLLASWITRLPSLAWFGTDVSLDPIAPLQGTVTRIAPATSVHDAHYVAWIMLLSVLTIALAYLSASLMNVLRALRLGSVNKSKILMMGEVLRDSPIDNLFFQSYIQFRPLLLTTDSGKVYVGTISELGEPNEAEGMDQEISVVPLMSGHRDKNTYQVVFDTDYSLVDTDLNVVIRQDKILSASWFDFDIYKQLNPKTNAVDGGQSPESALFSLKNVKRRRLA